MTEDVKRKKDGFQGQKAIVIPRKVLAARCVNDVLIGSVYITDLGYYPKAQFHYRKRPHGADQQILIYCHEGKGNVSIGKINYEISPGEFFIVPAKTAHTYAADEKKPWTIYWVHFKGNIAEPLVSLLESRAGGNRGFIKFPERSLSLFNEMYNELSRGYGIDHLRYANICLSQFLTTFIYNEKYNPSGKLPDKSDTDAAIDFMNRRIDQIITLEDIAAAVNLSPSHFSVLFKKKTGFTPIKMCIRDSSI